MLIILQYLSEWKNLRYRLDGQHIKDNLNLNDIVDLFE